MEMQHLKRPKTYVLKEEEAAKALKAYIAELKENKPDELTETQAEAMARLAEGLLSAISEETSPDSCKQSSLLPKIKNAVGGLFSASKEVSEPQVATPHDPSLEATPYYNPQSNRIR